MAQLFWYGIAKMAAKSKFFSLLQIPMVMIQNVFDTYSGLTNGFTSWMTDFFYSIIGFKFLRKSKTLQDSTMFTDNSRTNKDIFSKCHRRVHVWKHYCLLVAFDSKDAYWSISKVWKRCFKQGLWSITWELLDILSNIH